MRGHAAAFTVVSIGSSFFLANCQLQSTLAQGASDSTLESTLGSARLLAASGSLFHLGSDDPQAPPEERPGWTRFSHDFWLDTTEVTQGEFRSLLGRNPSSLVGDSLPVTDVTWFDAVLAANARSRRDHLDSVYEFSSIRFDQAGNAIDLQGLAVHLDHDGWRLPTEAEWEFAARAGSSSPYPWGTLADSALAPLYAWFQANAQSKVHPVASRKPNQWGFYDLTGNAMEWVGDWKGSFPADTIPDFSGAGSPSEIGDVPLKGGAFNFGCSTLRPSTRSAIYSATRSTKAQYVGFRLARGSLKARYAAFSGHSLDLPAVTLANIDPTLVLGTRSMRLAFLNRGSNKGTLSWVDFGESTPMVRILEDSLPVFHPVISPDGRWVAWSTTLEGSNDPSRIRARPLKTGSSPVVDLGPGAIPRWWIQGADTFLIRSGAMDNTADGWSKSPTSMRRWSNGSLQGPDMILSGSSYHDGRSGNWLYSGYRRLRQTNFVTGMARTLFTSPDNGKINEDTSQVCNVSAAPDSSGRVLFLDFGANSSRLVGRPYGIHEIAFLADSSGTVVAHFPAPSGSIQWEHLEWTNHPRWAVSASQSGNGANDRLHLLDLQTGATLPLASGTDLWQPALWIGERSLVPLEETAYDSAGRYFDFPFPEMEYFGDNLLRFWRLSDSLDLIVLGSSHFAAMLPSGFPSHHGLSLALPASTLSDWNQLIRKVIVPNAPRLKTIALTFMPGWLFPNPASPPNKWEPVLSPQSGFQFDLHHDFWQAKKPDAFLFEITKRMKERSAPLFPSPSTYVGAGWGSADPDFHPPASEDTAGAYFIDQFSQLEELIRWTNSKKINLILVSSPQSPHYQSTPYCGRYGPTWATYHSLVQKLRSAESTFPYFHFYDAHQNGKHDYSDSLAGNWDHLTPLGSEKLARRIDSISTRLP